MVIVGNFGSRSDHGGGRDVGVDARGRARWYLDVVSNDAAAATVTAAGSEADGGIDNDPTAAARSDDAASSMLEKGKRNKNGTNNIGIQAFDAILQLGVGNRLIAQLLSHDMWGRSSMPHSPSL
jgi:hypothetical protein